jgi:stage V sporulation protein G
MAGNKLDVRVYPIDGSKSSTKAFASVAVDELIAIRGIRVVNGEKGLFVTMPQSQDKESGEYHDIAFPLNGNLRKKIAKAVLGEYETTSKLDPAQRGYDSPGNGAANGASVADIKVVVRVFPITGKQGSTKAFASLSVNDLIAIRGIRVVDGEKGLFVTMPQSQDKEKNYHDVAFPLSGDLRKEISRAVLDEYKSVEKYAAKSLAGSLKKGAERAAENASTPREKTAKKAPGLGD